MISSLLLTEWGNRWMSSLDDSTSMTSIAIRDGLDTSGRTVMEYQRSQHGGRERLIEEVMTLLIWGFGIRFLKDQVYDPFMKRFTRIKHPDLDMSLLKDGPQKLTPELVERFNNHEKFRGAYDDLLKIAKNEGNLQKLQSYSTNAKFLIATGIPVLLIAFGIPTFNQWLTRQKLQKAQSENQPMPPVGAGHPVSVPSSGIQHPVAFTSFQSGKVSPFAQAQTPGFNGPPFTAAPLANPAAPMPGQTPRFAGLGGVTSMLLQNERYNTLLVDGVISGGRTYKARNWTERLEIMFREALVIFFLYFAQAPIQRFFSNLFDRKPDVHTQLPFSTMKHLHEVYGNNSSRFQADYKASTEHLVKLLGLSESELIRNTQQLEYIRNFRGVKRMINPERVAKLEKIEAELERRLTKAVQDYFLQGKSGDLFFETAKSGGWIPTFEKNGVQMLDLSKKIDMQPILRMVDAFGKVHEDLVKLLPKYNPVEAEALFGKIMKKSLNGRAGAMLLANGVCFFLLSILGPLVQHRITRNMTGKDYFPGVQAEQDQKASFRHGNNLA